MKAFITAKKELQKDFFEIENELLQMEQIFQGEHDDRLQKMMMTESQNELRSQMMTF